MDNKRLVIGITGGSGSGKTTFVKKVTEKHGPQELSILHMDSYYLPIQPKSNHTDKGLANYDHPSAFDWELLRFHIDQLKEGKEVESPTYDFTNHARSNETRKIISAPVIIVEGIFALFDQDIREMTDIKCFLHVDSDIRFTRRLHRDVKERGRSLEGVMGQYYDTVRPMYEKFLAPQKQYADIIIGEETDTAATVLSSHITQFLSEYSNRQIVPETNQAEQQPTEGAIH